MSVNFWSQTEQLGLISLAATFNSEKCAILMMLNILCFTVIEVLAGRL
jgi:hypothetical protein